MSHVIQMHSSPYNLYNFIVFPSCTRWKKIYIAALFSLSLKPSRFVTKVPLFEGTDLPFIRLLCTKVKPAHFYTNEYIVRKGDIGQEMFIIRKGLVRNFVLQAGKIWRFISAYHELDRFLFVI